jgi:hypothetical protein
LFPLSLFLIPYFYSIFITQIDEIFNQMMKAVGFDPQVIRDDAKRMLSLIKEGNPSADDILNAKDGELAQILIDVRYVLVDLNILCLSTFI